MSPRPDHHQSTAAAHTAQPLTREEGGSEPPSHGHAPRASSSSPSRTPIDGRAAAPPPAPRPPAVPPRRRPPHLRRYARAPSLPPTPCSMKSLARSLRRPRVFDRLRFFIFYFFWVQWRPCRVSWQGSPAATRRSRAGTRPRPTLAPGSMSPVARGTRSSGCKHLLYYLLQC